MFVSSFKDNFSWSKSFLMTYQLRICDTFLICVGFTVKQFNLETLFHCKIHINGIHKATFQ